MCEYLLHIYYLNEEAFAYIYTRTYIASNGVPDSSKFALFQQDYAQNCAKDALYWMLN